MVQNLAITNCFFAVNLRVVYSTKKALPSIQKDCVPATQKSSVIYEFTCQCDSGYVGCTTQRLEDRIKQHVPSSIRKKVVPKENSHLGLANLKLQLKPATLLSGSIYWKTQIVQKTIMATCFGLLVKPNGRST